MMTTSVTVRRAGAPARRSVVVRSNKPLKKTDVKKQGLERVARSGAASVYNNLAGRADKMKDKKWKDASGSPGKGMGPYRFEGKYGVNVDGYSPIYTPDIWSDSGESYSFGTGGLLAWAGLLVVLLAVGVNLIVSTSAIDPADVSAAVSSLN